jgi:predicted nucleotidyltransferase component of viral defense system
VEKDYVLGWVLFAIANHNDLGVWIFKGGTCLKKCFFDTYRFSEDLDFTVPSKGIYTGAEIENAVREVCEWVERESGIAFPPERLVIEELTNARAT